MGALISVFTHHMNELVELIEAISNLSAGRSFQRVRKEVIVTLHPGLIEGYAGCVGSLVMIAGRGALVCLMQQYQTLWLSRPFGDRDQASLEIRGERVLSLGGFFSGGGIRELTAG